MASNIGGLPEIICESQPEMLFRAGDVSDISRAIVQAWSKRESIHKLGQEARLRYEGRYTLEAHVSEYLKLLTN